MLAAVTGLLRLGDAVPEDLLEWLAAMPETVGPLWEGLNELGFTTLFPVEHHTQEAFAASDMARWLSFHTELGFVPSDLEVGPVVMAAPDGEDVADRFYLCRFSTDTASESEQGPFAGVAGPYPIDEPPTLHAGMTFSDFAPYGSATAVEHVSRIVGAVAEAFALHGQVDGRLPTEG